MINSLKKYKIDLHTYTEATKTHPIQHVHMCFKLDVFLS